MCKFSLLSLVSKLLINSKEKVERKKENGKLAVHAPFSNARIKEEKEKKRREEKKE